MRYMVVSIALLLMACGSEQKQEHEHVVPEALDMADMNPEVDPCDDFFEYAIGKWIDDNPIPEKESRWNPFMILRQKSKDDLLAILKDLQGETPEQGSERAKLKDFFLSGLENRQSPEALAPIQFSEEQIDSFGLLHTFGTALPLGVSNPIRFSIYADKRNSDAHAVYLSQSGLGLPNRDYYLETSFSQLRSKYIDHINDCFAYASWDGNATDVLEIETALAQISWTNAANRDPVATYNKVSIAEFQTLFPNVPFRSFLSGLGLPQADTVILVQKSYFEALNSLIPQYSHAQWTTYMNWQLLRAFGDLLNEEFSAKHFAFYGETLRGKKKIGPLDERVAMVVNSYMGHPLGKLYVERHFNAESKEDVISMIENIRNAYRQRIQSLAWMSTATKENALRKLDAFGYKIGYPDEWKDFSTIEIQAESYVQNVLNGRAFAHQETLNRWGQPVDRKEWNTLPQTVNAFYVSSKNEIVFPAAILQPPFYHRSYDPAINYGAIGTVIGHEFTHGFDDKGSQYDWDGNLRNWWSEEDRSQFESLAQALVKQYEGYSPLEGYHLDGKNTLGENIADMGGVTLSYYALQELEKEVNTAPIDEMMWNQRFFFGFANVWKGGMTDKEIIRRIKTDSHSPGKYRVIGSLVNFTPFHESFGTCEGKAMHKPDSARIRIW